MNMNRGIWFSFELYALYADFLVEELPDFSNSYFVESQKNYLVELNSLSVPKGFEDFDSKYILSWKKVIIICNVLLLFIFSLVSPLQK